MCTQTREELNAPYVEEDRLADEYSRSQAFEDDRGAIAESWRILEENSVDFGTVVMRKFDLSYYELAFSQLMQDGRGHWQELVCLPRREILWTGSRLLREFRRIASAPLGHPV